MNETKRFYLLLAILLLSIGLLIYVKTSVGHSLIDQFTY